MATIERTPVDSRLLKSIGYDPDNKVLHVEFQSGSTYTYHDVSAETHADLMASKSFGSHFLKHVKNQHAYKRVTK